MPSNYRSTILSAFMVCYLDKLFVCIKLVRDYVYEMALMFCIYRAHRREHVPAFAYNKFSNVEVEYTFIASCSSNTSAAYYNSI